MESGFFASSMESWNGGILVYKGILLFVISGCLVEADLTRIPHAHLLQTHYSIIPTFQL
jgi:hypothetical protein